MDDRDIVLALRIRSDDISGPAAGYIERLEAVVRAGDEMHKAIIGSAGGIKRIAVASGYRAARSRVNLPTTSNSSVTDGHESADKCGPDCSLEVLRPGKFQCNGDGAKCPNKEGTDEHSS